MWKYSSVVDISEYDITDNLIGSLMSIYNTFYVHNKYWLIYI